MNICLLIFCCMAALFSRLFVWLTESAPGIYSFSCLAPPPPYCPTANPNIAYPRPALWCSIDFFQELEKFRFVLDYKIKELKLQIAPREHEIATMRKQIEEMDLELEQYHKSNQALNLMISELKLKIDGLRREMELQEQRIDANARLTDKYKRDLQELWEARQDANLLKSKMVTMYRVYVQEDLGAAASGDDATDSEDPQQVRHGTFSVTQKIGQKCSKCFSVKINRL